MFYWKMDFYVLRLVISSVKLFWFCWQKQKNHSSLALRVQCKARRFPLEEPLGCVLHLLMTFSNPKRSGIFVQQLINEPLDQYLQRIDGKTMQLDRRKFKHLPKQIQRMPWSSETIAQAMARHVEKLLTGNPFNGRVKSAKKNLCITKWLEKIF